MYNVFKRPMFKRGGSTQGTGIMSHVEPRVRAANGFPNFQASPMNPSQVDAFRQLEADRLAKIKANRFSGILGPRFTDPSFTSPFSDFFTNRTGFEVLKPGGTLNEEIITANLKAPQAKSPRAMGADAEIDKEIVKTIPEDPLKPEIKIGKEDPKYVESDIRSEVTKEAKMLKELLGEEGYSKGELALLVAGALKEPGGITAKLDKARELALPLARKRKEEDKAITLAAYKLAKEKEIAGAKQTQQEKLIDEYVSANIKDPANTKSANELRREAVNKYFGGKEDTQKEYNVAQLAQYETPDKISGKSLLTKAQEDKQELEALKSSGKKLNENQEQKLARSIAIIEKVKELRTSIGFTGLASGGRVGFAEGSEDVDTTNTLKKDIDQAVKPIEATNVAEGDQSVPMKPVQKLSFEELRNRLPKEITNDVVQLIANSEEALQDFAYIRDQEDVNSFNVKYGVNLILPPETV